MAAPLFKSRTPPGNRADAPCVGGRAGFTLIELLVVLGIIGLLLAILLPALRAGREAAYDLRCRANMRAVLMSFRDFADVTGSGSRGDSNALGPNLFRLEDFQEDIYQIDEFWSGERIERRPIEHRSQALMCPAGPRRLERRSGLPCSAGAIGPQKNVSVAFNSRLHRKTAEMGGIIFARQAYLADQILNYPDVPLIFDVDGEEAAGRNVLPYYSAPPLKDKGIPDIYRGGNQWFPSFRHSNRRMNIGYIGGHVLSSASPLSEPWSRWGYQPK
ncbi:MAG: prepilin-type N-terminal cleavage/methylation domain-containing protein [Phycisphaerae bacterium]